MGVAVAVERPAEPLEPGTEHATRVRVRNTGAVVDLVHVDVVGDAADWTRVEPGSLNLLPGEEGSVEVVFAPPRSHRIPAGVLPYAVRAMSQEDTGGSVIDEGTLEIAAYSEMAAELVPRTSTGRTRGNHQLALDNLGNHPLVMSLVAADADRKLRFELSPASITLQPGTATFVKVLAKPRDTFWRGKNVTIPFEITASPESSEPMVLKGTMVQTAILPSWFVKVMVAAVAGLVALTVLWFAVLRPTVESTARAVAEDNTEKLAAAITAASDKAADAQEQAAAAQAAAGGAGGAGGAGASGGAGGAGGSGTATGKGGRGGAGGQGADGSSSTGSGADSGADGRTSGGTVDASAAVDFRVTTDVPPVGEFQNSTYAPPEDTIVWISDLVLQNPAGDQGTLRIQRGDDVLMVFGLENFRDLDYHFIQPASFTKAAPVVVAVDCTNATRRCSPSVYFAGQKASTAKSKARKQG